MKKALRRTANFFAFEATRGVRIVAKEKGATPRQRTVSRRTWDILATMSDTEFDGSVCLELGVGCFKANQKSKQV